MSKRNSNEVYEKECQKQFKTMKELIKDNSVKGYTLVVVDDRGVHYFANSINSSIASKLVITGEELIKMIKNNVLSIIFGSREDGKIEYRNSKNNYIG